MLPKFRNCLRALPLLLFFPASPVWAQVGVVAGRVTDAETASPLAAVAVSAIGAGDRIVAGAYTSNDGRYRLSLPAGTYTVRFEILGYAALDVNGVDVAGGGTAAADAALQPGAIIHDPLVISVSKGEPEKSTRAPATNFTVDRSDIQLKPATTPIQHVRSVPGVEVIEYGVYGSNVTTRGFNNIFSGSLHMLTDYRLAHVPSLRVNLAHFVPANNEDLDRIEVVLGPGSALYGPNTASGVLHMITRSPLDEQGTTVSLAGGERSFMMGEFRTAHLLATNLAFKLSGRYVSADEWEFIDPTEQQAKAAVANNPAYRAALRIRGVPDEEIDRRFARIGNRDFDLQQWAGEARLDWMSSGGVRTVLSAGNTNVVSGVEMTGLGAAQVDNWRYSYVQARGTYNRLFGQVYFNASDAGDTYTLKDGEAVIDRSKLFVGQLQHGFDLMGRYNLIYGVDFIATRPESEGTIYGKFDSDDDMNEVGAYLQARAPLQSTLDLVVAGRVDKHSELPDPVFSPRAALVFTPLENQTVRLTYNRAFSTPTAINLFLDKSGGLARGLEALLFLSRGQGTGRDGYRFQNPDGTLTGMRSPFYVTLGGQPAPATLLPADGPTVAAFWDAAINVVAAQSAQAGQPIPAALVAYIKSPGVRPAAGQSMGVALRNLLTGQITPLAPNQIPDIERIRESITSTIELGYQGTIAQRLQVAAGVWRSDHSDFVSPLIPVTPLVSMNSADVEAHLVPRLWPAIAASNPGMSQAQAEATARTIAQGMARVPIGVVSSEAVNANGADIMATYVNAGDVTLWGADAAVNLLVSPVWSVSATGSWFNEDHLRIPFGGVDQILALNSSPLKGSVGVAYNNQGQGINGEVRARYTDGFPANSADFRGLQCLGVADSDPCVNDYTVLDLTLGYRLPLPRRPQLQLSVTNLLDEEYRSFVGVPEIGRLALLRLRYEF